MRNSEVPIIDITITKGGDKPSCMAEVGVPSVASTVVNAIARTNDQRIRSLPIIKT